MEIKGGYSMKQRLKDLYLELQLAEDEYMMADPELSDTINYRIMAIKEEIGVYLRKLK